MHRFSGSTIISMQKIMNYENKYSDFMRFRKIRCLKNPKYIDLYIGNLNCHELRCINDRMLLSSVRWLVSGGVVLAEI